MEIEQTQPLRAQRLERPVLTLRHASERGYADHGWLRSYHTFSFADYYDSEHMGFRALRVINQDRIAPERGFGAHSHSDMEILTYVLEGELAHQDSLGNGSIIRPGEVQRMSAGTGVVHSERNASSESFVHLLQVWIIPAVRGLAPSYEQKFFPITERRGRLRLVASPNGRDRSVVVHQDMLVYTTVLRLGERARHELAPARFAWIHVARGALEVNGTYLEAGDGAAVSEPGTLELVGHDFGEALLFDLS